MTTGQTAQFQVTVTGSSGSNGGVNIAVSSGILAAVSTFLKTSGGELVHNARVAVPSTYVFNYTAPASPGSVTMYATGKDNVFGRWNWSPDYAITVSGGAAPAAPVLSAPSNNAIGQTANVAFTWGASSGATNYTLQVSLDSLFGTTNFNDTTLTGTTRTVGPLLSQRRYFWRVSAKNANGWSSYSSLRWFTTGTFTAVTEQSVRPDAFSLQQNFPNPFNPSTSIGYNLTAVSKVRLIVYDLLGHEVATLANGTQAPGYYRVQFNAEHLASGVYLYQLKAETVSEEPGSPKGVYVETRKLVLLR
jgi:hypothetical protein